MVAVVSQLLFFLGSISRVVALPSVIWRVAVISWRLSASNSSRYQPIEIREEAKEEADIGWEQQKKQGDRKCGALHSSAMQIEYLVKLSTRRGKT